MSRNVTKELIALERNTRNPSASVKYQVDTTRASVSRTLLESYIQGFLPSIAMLPSFDRQLVR